MQQCQQSAMITIESTEERQYMDRCTRQQYSQLYLGQFALLSPQSGALRRGAFRDFHPIPVTKEKSEKYLADWRLFLATTLDENCYIGPVQLAD